MDQNYDHFKTFGGWLLVFYWFSIVGGALTLLTMALPSLIGITASFMYIGAIYGVGVLVNVVSTAASSVFYIKSAIEMKARKPQFFDTLVLALLVMVFGGIISDLLTIRSARGIGGFVSFTIFTLILLAICLCIYIMYFSKSVRVKVYFEGRPLHNSKYWIWIKLLPAFIISESMPEPPASPAGAEEKPVFCGECGAKNESGTKFCGSCGKPL